VFDNEESVIHPGRKGGWIGSHVDVMHCVMLKNISHESNGYCRKIDWGINWGSINI